ncbi:hypothetical protein [Winogradskyella sp.]|uniref:hypothetical protein n=1 Tax=Winogradskyella sp. TaxID=1883156 RepID=UPI003BAC37AD
MAVRNQNARRTTNYKIITHEGVRYYLQVGAFQVKNVIYTAKRNIENNRLKAPEELIKTGKTILVMCNGKGNYDFSLI